MISLLARTMTAPAVAALALLVFGPPASAQIANGGFEAMSGGNSTFSPWTTIGSTLIVTATFGDTPTEGTHQALLTNDPTAGDYGTGSVPVASLTTFFNLAPTALTSRNVTDGSGIKQTFTLTQFSTLQFSYDFLTTEDPNFPPYNNDFAFFTLASGNGTAALTTVADTAAATIAETLPPGPPSPTAGDFLTETGYHIFSTTTALAPGIYTLGFGVANVNDTAVASSVLLDNIVVKPVPEAGTFVSFGLLLGMGGLLLVRRQTKSGVKA